MARLESEGKAGFYPTPVEEMELILKRLSYSTEGIVSLLDPCCGKGDALKQWKNDATEKGSFAKSYGIEIEKSRAREAKLKNDYVLNCGYEEAKMSHGAFSAIYLNPPFNSINGERQEKIFLNEITNDYLQTGELLILNIPQYILRDCGKIIASRFKNIKIYRFTDKNYYQFKQVIVFGIRRKGIRTIKEKEYQIEMEKELYNLSFLGQDAIPSLAIEDWHEVKYFIPTQTKKVKIFESMKIEKEDILNSMRETSFFHRIQSKINNSSINGGKKITPAATLKKTHIAAAIASGALPEEMSDHLLVGVTKRVKEEKTEIDYQSGKEKEVTTFKPKSFVRVFSSKGIFNLK